MSPIGYVVVIAIAGGLAWGGIEHLRGNRLEREVAERDRVIQAHEAGAQAWDTVYRQQEKEAQGDILDAIRWWQDEKGRGDRLARDLAQRLRDAPSGARTGGGVPEGGSLGSALAACERRLDDAAGAFGGVVEAVEGVAAAGAGRGVRAEALARVLQAAPCVRAGG